MTEEVNKLNDLVMSHGDDLQIYKAYDDWFYLDIQEGRIAFTSRVVVPSLGIDDMLDITYTYMAGSSGYFRMAEFINTDMYKTHFQPMFVMNDLI